MEIDERKLEERSRLLSHCDYFFRPPASFYAELEKAIALAAAGTASETMGFGGGVVPAAQLIEQYQLQEFVERAMNPERRADADLHRSGPVRRSP